MERHTLSTEGWTLLLAITLLLLLCPSLVAGISLSPCGSDGTQEVLADQKIHFTCRAEGHVIWRLQYYDNRLQRNTGSKETVILATCDTTCLQMKTFDGLFTASVVNTHRKAIIINTVNNTRLYHNVQLVSNSSLECAGGDDDPTSAGCELIYVYPPKGVACTAVNTTWSVTVSCVISSVYSSRGLYTCQLYREKQGSGITNLHIVAMMTSSTRERITKNEVKMSGSCQFNTTLPAEEGNYGFYVAVSPGGRTYSVKFIAGYEWIAIRLPKPATMSCAPHPYVLENTEVTCTCRTTSIGQPVGYLSRRICNPTGNGKAPWQDENAYASQELQHTQVLTLLDHGRTCYRCDIRWGLEEFRGENYTARVGYAARTLLLLVNGREENETVTEGQEVYFECKSNGRPPPQLFISNDYNHTVTKTDSFLTNFTSIARCEDTALYTCSAWNEFSAQSGVTKSRSLSLSVKCKPRALGKVTIVHRRRELSFDVVSYPKPHEISLRFEISIKNNSDYIEEVKGSVMNVTCKAYTQRLYLSRCTLTVLNLPSQSSNGFYKVEVINEVGKETFSFGLIFGELFSFVLLLLHRSSKIIALSTV